IHQRRAATPTEIGTLPAAHLVVAPHTELMLGTGAAVGEAAVPALRYTGQIQAAGRAWLGAQRRRDGTPLRPVRSYIAQSIQQIGHVMCDLVRHGLCQSFIEMFGQYIRVVTYQPSAALDAVHPGGAAPQIEVHRN